MIIMSFLNNKKCDNIPEFLGSEGYIIFDPNGHIAIRELYDVYHECSNDNSEKACVLSFFSKFLRANAKKYGLIYVKNIMLRNGKKVRGYRGVCKHPGPNPFENAIKVA